MIAADAPALSFGGLTLLRDDTDAQQWYYWPDRPSLEVDAGKPSFTLTKYRYDLATLPAGAESGGAILQLKVGLHVETDRLASASQAIRAATGAPDPRLQPVAARSSNIRLIVPSIAPAVLPAAPQTKPPGNAAAAAPNPSGTATFARSLTIEEATLVGALIAAPVAAMSGAGEPAGVVYDVVADGMQADLPRTINGNWERVNALLVNTFGGARVPAAPVTAADVEAFVADRVRDGTIELGGLPGAPSGAEGAAIMSRIQRFVTQTFFVPLPATQPAADSRQRAFALRSPSADVLAGLNAAVNAAGVVAFPLTARAQLAELVAPYPASSLIAFLDLSESQLATLKVHVMASEDLATAGIAAIKVSLEYGGRNVLCLLTRAQPTAQAEFALDVDARRTYRSWFTVLFEDGPAIESGQIETDEAILIVDPQSVHGVPHA